MIRLNAMAPLELTPEQRSWAQQDAQQQALQLGFQGARRAIEGRPVGAMDTAGGRMEAATPWVGRAGAVRAVQGIPDATPAGALGKLAGGAGLAWTGYQATQHGAPLRQLWDSAEQMRPWDQPRAFQRAARTTHRSAGLGLVEKGGAGAAAGSAFGPLGAAVGGGVAGLTAYGSALREGLRSHQARSAMLDSATPGAGGKNAPEFGMHLGVAQGLSGATPWFASSGAAAIGAALGGGAILAGAHALRENADRVRGAAKSVGKAGKRFAKKLSDLL